MKIYRVELD